jgi:hypothetical protein
MSSAATTEIPIKPSATVARPEQPKKKKNLGMHLVAGGVAGCCEALACHPLDTIKVRLQLRGERQIRTKPISLLEGSEALKAAAAEAAKVLDLRGLHDP